MLSILRPYSFHEAHLIVNGKDCGVVIVQFIGKKPVGDGLFALLSSKPPSGCTVNQIILSFSSYVSNVGETIYIVTPDKEFPDHIEI